MPTQLSLQVMLAIWLGSCFVSSLRVPTNASTLDRFQLKGIEDDCHTSGISNWTLSLKSRISSGSQANLKRVRRKSYGKETRGSEKMEAIQNFTTLRYGDNYSSSRAVRNPMYFPQVNFYSTVAMSIGVLGNGLLCLRELSNIIGTPLPLWIGHIPMFMFAIALIFVPDFRPLGIPLFYTNDIADDDIDPQLPLEPIKIFLPESIEFLKNNLLKIADNFLS